MPTQAYPINQPINNASEARQVLRESHRWLRASGSSDEAVDRVIEAIAYQLCELWDAKWAGVQSPPDTEASVLWHLFWIDAKPSRSATRYPAALQMLQDRSDRLREWFGTARGVELFGSSSAARRVGVALRLRYQGQGQGITEPSIDPGQGARAVLERMMTPAHARRAQAAVLHASTPPVAGESLAAPRRL